MKTMKVDAISPLYELDEFWLDKLESIIKEKYPDLQEMYDEFYYDHYDMVTYTLSTDNLPDELRPPFQEAVDWLNENKDKYYLPDVDKFVL